LESEVGVVMSNSLAKEKGITESVREKAEFMESVLKDKLIFDEHEKIKIEDEETDIYDEILKKTKNLLRKTSKKIK
jgi:hypothetical protein